ncbi:MAG TPA: O-antigen ligase family protein [Verrucomicrobiae bacterium]|nr:O-antigen ligase family protein [Verrucomicrobiae bacterium]
MTCKLFTTWFKAGVVVVALSALLFGGDWHSPPRLLGDIVAEIAFGLKDAEVQWIVFLCLGTYLAVFLFLRLSLQARTVSRFQGVKAVFCLACLVFLDAAMYFVHYSPSAPALILLAGVVIGQGFALCATVRRGLFSLSILHVLFPLVSLLALASAWQDGSHIYEYRLVVRLTGPWNNPNIFGLLMGVGLVLALGSAVSVRSPGWNQRRMWRHICIILCLLAALPMARGLLQSYSRGAWLATGCGAVYLAGFYLWVSDFGTCKFFQLPIKPHWLQKNGLALAIVLFSSVVLLFWGFRETEWHAARRVLSVADSADFSSRNRISAWIGDLQIIAEHPWFGVGWNGSEPLYEHYYLPSKLSESAAIEMNDFLLLGAALGMPAFFCLATYLWLSFKENAKLKIGNPEVAGANWLGGTCRASAIVLLVGFWFDGGLFQLPTAAVFWVLLELGGAQSYKAIRQIDEIF